MNDKQPDSLLSTDAEAMERLRDRTDELELIISSLTIFALFSLPGWLFDKIADVFTHLSTSLAITVVVGMSVLAGTCYGLGACFVIHLMARAYWVGLIGLRTVFPEGINWSKTPGLGPLSRRYYQDSLPDLDTVIQKTDRVASSLFAVISMLTLGLLWFGTILVSIVVVSGVIGAEFGGTNAGIGIGGLALLTVFIGVPILVYVLDALLAARFATLAENRVFAGIVRILRRIAGLAYPQRLLLPVQLTLQSNTRPVIFYIVLFVSVLGIVSVGTTRVTAWRSFTLSDEFVYMDAEQIQSGFRSTFYEDMSSPIDKLIGAPRIDSFYQRGSFVRLFLPYQPLRDNLVLEEWCEQPEDPARRNDCVRALWSVSIDGRPVPMSSFVPAQRADLGMRGLIGLVPLSGLEPGLHEIVVIWNQSAVDDGALPDDRYSQVLNRIVIPIAFAPEFELPLHEQPPATPE